MPRSWSLKRFLRLDSKTDAKQNEQGVFENKNEKSFKEDSRKKRKAPDIPNQPKSKFGATEVNGSSNPTLPLPIVHQPHRMTASSESLTTSSSGSSDYSPSSRSITFSSFSGSVETVDNPQNLSVKSLNTNHFEMLHGCDPTGPNTKAENKVSSFNLEKETATNSNELDHVKPTIDANGCSDISEYVEKAILVSSQTSQNKSSEKTSDLQTPLHHPPRLTSFESSSILHHEGLQTSNSTSEPESAGLNLRYVTMDFVKSAAAEERTRKDTDKSHDTVGSSSSSLSSSFISSLDSEVGSTIGSDVVESLYNKITAASAKYKKKNMAVTSPTVSTGDIQKDLFPLIFPGHSQPPSNSNNNKQPNASTNNGDDRLFLRESKDQELADSNFSNNKTDSLTRNRSSNASDLQSADVLQNGVHHEEVKTTGLNKCDFCGGVKYNLNETMDGDMTKAKSMFGQCTCEEREEEEITDMDYTSCNLKEVPEEVGDYASTLETLVLESNTITELPMTIFLCRNLSYLSVSDNDIASLPPMLAKLVNLKYLDISKNVIEDIPECISSCKSLEIFDASVNPIEKLTEGFTQLSNLQELYMNDCFFDFLPAGFGKMTQLKTLELRDNQLQLLPKSMKRLAELTRLDLGGNAFQDFPDAIPKMSSLSEFWLDCNELGQVPSEIGNLGKLRYLDLSRNFLEVIPSQIGFLDQLTDLILAENSITSLPDSIGFLSCLKVLNLELNQLEELPVSFGKLKSLEEADISHNKLEYLPTTIGKLRKLHTLLLHENQLSSVPDEIGSCCELNILQLSRNRIEKIPSTIGDLHKLRVLNICQNRVPHLPITISKLKKLEALWVSPNQSKPKIQLHTEIDSKSRTRILTNVLFPQEENGQSRVSKVLGQPDEDDDDAYANDAADDDDLDAYARRERGRTHVIFNLAAITYSDEVAMNGCDEDVDEINDTTFNMPPIQNETVEISIDEKSVDGSLLSLSAEKDCSLESKQHVNDASKPLLSPHLQEHNQESNILDNDNVMEVDIVPPAEIPPDDSSVSRPHYESSEEGEPFTDIDFDSDNEIVIPSDEEASPLPPPTLGSGLRTWSSRSNLPSALTEITEEWNPDEDAPGPKTPDASIPEKAQENPEPLNSQTSKFGSRLPEPNDKFKNISNTDSKLKDPMVENSTLTNKPNRMNTNQPQISYAKKPIEAQKKPVLNKQDIPFMDIKEKENSASTQNSVPKKKASRKVDSRTADDDFKNADNLVLSSDYVINKKTSSVTSGEGAPVTDHDSGVGNDVESQESVADLQEDSLSHINEKDSSSKVLGEYSSGGRKKGTSVRRNENGWIGLVRTDNAMQNKASTFVPKTSFSESVVSSSNSHMDLRNKANITPSRYVPATTLDITKVTYSHEYHKARYLNQNRSPLKNQVSDNIKKFENYSETKPIAINTNQRKSVSNSHSEVTLPSKSPQNRSADISTNSNKPQAIATILHSSVRPRTGASLKQEQVASKHIPTSVQDEVTSLESYVKTWDSKEIFVPNETEQPQTPRSDSSRRSSAHARKSKFDEALAATKHKHFRDKLEKMMLQQHKDSSAVQAPTRRLSRGSTSSIASMPRITSPVPHHHSNTSFEQMTADSAAHHEDRFSRSSKSESNYTKLKEKLQHPANLNSTTHSSNSRQNPTISRDRPGSGRTIGRRQTTQRSSLRSKSNLDQTNEQKPNKSIEEQLGQLLIEENEQHFDSQIPPNPHQGPPRSFSTDPKRFSNSGKTRPADWKDQLLQYLERKKIESGKLVGTESLGRSFQPDSRPKSPSYSRNPDFEFHAHRQSRSGYVNNDHRSGLQNRHATSVPEINMPQGDQAMHPDHMTKSQSTHFSRSVSTGHSRSSGRRSSGRYQRNRTPGPEMSNSTQTDAAVRPRSAMEMPTQHFEQVEPTMTHNSEKTQNTQKHHHPTSNHMNGAPPSYEDHLLRRGGVATWNQQNFHDYVNVDYLHQIRASMHQKPAQQATIPVGYPLRSTESHDSVLNQKHEKQHPYDNELSPAMKSSASHNSIVDKNRSKSTSRYQYPAQKHSHYEHQHGYPQSRNPQEYHHKSKEGRHRQHSEKRKDYGVIPAPSKTVKQPVVKPPVRSEDYRSRSKKSQRNSAENYGYPAPFRAYPPQGHPFLDDPGKPSNRLSAAFQHGHMEREDESVASAFRPYHQKQSIGGRPSEPSHRNDVFDDYSAAYHHHDHGRSHYHTRDAPNHSSYQYHGRNHDHKKHRDPTLTERAQQHWKENDAGVEIVTVTVRKNPTFGFHIMGGVDAGGNPYRPDDDGVFITYVAPGGSADTLVQPGDKILLVNGSDFVGITHRRAVDLLRNAGRIAVLVVERLVGRPV